MVIGGVPGTPQSDQRVGPRVSAYVAERRHRLDVYGDRSAIRRSSLLVAMPAPEETRGIAGQVVPPDEGDDRCRH